MQPAAMETGASLPPRTRSPDRFRLFAWGVLAYNLAVIHRVRGERQIALGYVQRALQHDANNQPARDLLAQLESGR